MLSKMKPIATIDNDKFYVEQSLVCIIPHGILTNKPKPAHISLEFILGIINSKLEQFYFSTTIIDYSLGGGLIHATPGSQGKFIIPDIPVIKINPIETLVTHMLNLHKRTPQTPFEQEQLQREIAATDAQIDQLVYELYGLTDEEIRIVEDEGN